MNNYFFEELKVGIEEGFSVLVTDEMMKRFLKTTNDSNPLHVDQVYAGSQGFKDVVVYGMLTSSFYSTLVGVYLPGKYAILQGINIKFNKPVFVGDNLNVTGKVDFINNTFKMIEIKSKIFNQDDVLVSSAKISVGLFK